MSEYYDDLDAYIAKRATKNPAFPAMVDAALMGTTQPALARLERGEIDPKLSTLERYAEALGLTIALLR